MYVLVSFFFFSSRRRHTRSKRDWSSDVCSSDLLLSPLFHSTSHPIWVQVVSTICNSPDVSRYAPFLSPRIRIIAASSWLRFSGSVLLLSNFPFIKCSATFKFSLKKVLILGFA